MGNQQATEGGGSAADPALFGFDESIDEICADAMRKKGMTPSNEFGHAGNCIAANYNILSLYGNRVPYNICRNLEWQAPTASRAGRRR